MRNIAVHPDYPFMTIYYAFKQSKTGDKKADGSIND